MTEIRARIGYLKGRVKYFEIASALSLGIKESERIIELAEMKEEIENLEKIIRNNLTLFR